MIAQENCTGTRQCSHACCALYRLILISKKYIPSNLRKKNNHDHTFTTLSLKIMRNNFCCAVYILTEQAAAAALVPDGRQQSSTACLEWSSRASSVWIWWGPAVQAAVPTMAHQFLPVICTSGTQLTYYTWKPWEQPPALLRTFPPKTKTRHSFGNTSLQKLFPKTSMDRNALSVTPAILPNLIRTSQQAFHSRIYPHGI